MGLLIESGLVMVMSALYSPMGKLSVLYITVCALCVPSLTPLVGNTLNQSASSPMW